MKGRFIIGIVMITLICLSGCHKEIIEAENISDSRLIETIDK